jgi:hypothetical protein
MKRYYAAAGALLLGTSALAWAGSTNKPIIEPVATSDTKTEMSWDKSMTADAKPILVADSSMNVKKQWTPVYAELDQDLEKLALAETGKVQTASADSWTGTKIETAAVGDKVETAWVETDTVAKVETASVDKVDATGMGGPLEEIDPAVSAAVVQPSNADPEHDARGIPVISDAAFVPPGYNNIGGAVGGPVEGGDDESYPACTATVTDNCIQTYERGVDASLASSGSSDSSKSTAMGGPFEPVDADSAKLAMNGDGDIDVANGEIADGEIQVASVDPSIAGHSDHQGVGGPVEAQSGYPPCSSPGPGDDRCIQLFEPGVTGAGN